MNFNLYERTHIVKFVLLMFLIFSTGCTKNPNVASLNTDIKISNSKNIAYAIIDKNGKLLKTVKALDKNNNYEYIRITRDGFYPSYFTKRRGCSNYKKSKYYGGNSRFCTSLFISSDILTNSTIALFQNTTNTIMNLGLNFVVGDILIAYKFDENKFKNFIKQNNLESTRKIIVYADQHNVNFTNANILTKNYINKQIKIKKIEQEKLAKIKEEQEKLAKIKEEQEKLAKIKEEEKRIERERVAKINAEIEAKRYREMMYGVAIKSYCDTKWTMVFWQEDEKGQVCKKIGKQKWMQSCFRAYSKIDYPTSDQITEVAKKQWKLK